jgi:hypothetical protein
MIGKGEDKFMEERHPILDLPGANEKITRYWKTYSPASDGMLCFDDDYEMCLKHIKMLPNIRTITDIGCAWGVQSLFFEDYMYIGVDSEHAPGIDDAANGFTKIPFFEEKAESRKYFVATFPRGLTDEMIGDCFISNMSIGYGYLGGATDEEIKAAYARFPCGFIRSQKEIVDLVFEAFPYRKAISKINGMFNTLWFVSKTEM